MAFGDVSILAYGMSVTDDLVCHGLQECLIIIAVWLSFLPAGQITRLLVGH